MHDKLKESFSKSEHFGWVICRERKLHFFQVYTNLKDKFFSQVGTNPKDTFFSQEGTNSKELGTFPKKFIVVVLYGTI